MIAIDLKKIKQFSVFRRKLELILIRKLNLQQSSMRREIETSDLDEFIDILKDFFNQQNYLLQPQKRTSRSKQRFLLCLDNCEHLLAI